MTILDNYKQITTTIHFDYHDEIGNQINPYKAKTFIEELNNKRLDIWKVVAMFGWERDILPKCVILLKVSVDGGVVEEYTLSYPVEMR